MKAKPYTDKFISDLKLKMGELKIRQTTLAARLGTSKQYVYCFFKRTRNPCGETVLKIQELLKNNFKMF